VINSRLRQSLWPKNNKIINKSTRELINYRFLAILPTTNARKSIKGSEDADFRLVSFKRKTKKLSLDFFQALVLAAIQPVELRRNGVTPSLACHAKEPGHLLQSVLTCPPSANAWRLKWRHQFVPRGPTRGAGGEQCLGGGTFAEKKE